MKKLIFIILILFSFVNDSYSIDKIFLTNIDSTAATAPSPPTGGSLLTTGGVYISAIGTFYGITDSLVKTSADAITWTNTPSQPATANFQGIQVLTSGRVIVLSSDIPCKIYYSDNQGTTWIQRSLSPFNDCTDFGQRDNLKCSGTTCYTAVETGTSVLNVLKSTNSGHTWSFAGNPGGFDNSGHNLAYYDGTNVVVTGGFVSPCSSTTEGRILTSTNDGSTWNVFVRPSVCAQGGDTYYGASKLGNTYYITMERPGINSVILATTTNLINFSLDIFPTLTPPISNAVNYLFLNTFVEYNPDTMFLGILDNTALLLKIYGTSDGTNFNLIYNTGINSSSGNFIFDGNFTYFGDTTYRYYKLQ